MEEHILGINIMHIGPNIWNNKIWSKFTYNLLGAVILT